MTYVTGDVAGAMESPVYAILKLGPEMDKFKAPGGYPSSSTPPPPRPAERYSIKWDGEWHITYEVFRDLGIAFAAVLILIYVLVVGWFQSFITPLVIMAAIPFSLVGILPAHGLMGAFFTATSMIGFIAGAGIVVRNSIILVDFVELRLAGGMPLDEAVSTPEPFASAPCCSPPPPWWSAARVILFDPIFQGLAIALMAGEIASLAALAYDRPHRLLHHQPKEENNMTVDRYLRLIAGAFHLLSVALGYWVTRTATTSPPLSAEPVPVRLHRLVPDGRHSRELGAKRRV